MKKRSIAVLLLVCTLFVTFAGCSSKLYDYDKYADLIRLASPDGVEIFLSEINDGIVDTYRGSVKKDDIKETTYQSANDKILIERSDKVNINYVGKIDGVEFEGGSATKYDLTIGSNSFIDGFEDGLIGYTVGDKPVLNLRFPDDYHNEKYSGKDVEFTVTINSITRNAYPEYNDENVKKYTEYDTVEKFEEATRKETIENLLWQEYFKLCKVIKYPKKELTMYYENSVNSVTQNAAMFGMTLSSFVSSYYGYSDMKSFYQYIATQAQSSVKQELMILAFIESKPELKFTEEQYEQKVKELYDEYVAENSYTESLKHFKKEFGRDALEITLYRDVVIEYLDSKKVISDDVTKNGFVKDRVGVRYYENDVMFKGWHELEIDGVKKLYYFDTETGYAPAKCALVTPKDETTAKYLEFGENGVYVGLYDGRYDDITGTRFFKNGSLITGWQEFDLNEDGTNETYFLHLEDGYMLKGIQKADDDKYHDFGKDGIHVGIVTDGLHADDRGTRYFLNGLLVTGWQDIDVDKDGTTEKYYFIPGSEGYMCVGATIEIEGVYHTFDKGGKYAGVANGFVNSALGMRYFKDGVLQLGSQDIAEGPDTHTYYFKEPDGYAIISNWLTEKNDKNEDIKKFYFDDDGHKVKSTTMKIDNITYIFDENGYFTIQN